MFRPPGPGACRPCCWRPSHSALTPARSAGGRRERCVIEVCWTVWTRRPCGKRFGGIGVLARLGRGEAVRVLQAEGTGFLVADGWSKGWVFHGQVAAEAPLPAPASLFEPLPASMILAEAADTARSARSQASTSQIACAELNVALEQHFTPDMLERFLRDGAIAEFAPEQSQPPKAPLWRRITAYGGETERQAGLNLAARILRSKAKAAFGLSLGRYVNLVALAVARHAPGILPGVRVVVLELSEPVSFSLPGGLVMLSTGTLAALDNEAQLALLLAHELAHAALGHLWAGAQGAAFFLRGGTLDRTRAGDPLFTELLDQLEETALVRGLNPKFEYEADLAAMDMAWRAGYDPREYPALLHRMHDAAKGKPRTTAPRDWPALHPQTGERLAHVASMLARIPETGLALARERFQANR